MIKYQLTFIINRTYEEVSEVILSIKKIHWYMWFSCWNHCYGSSSLVVDFPINAIATKGHPVFVHPRVGKIRKPLV